MTTNTFQAISLLPREDNQNGWLRILPALAPARHTLPDRAVDYAIIGGGYTGLAGARRLAELKPDASIALVDAGRIGNNAAGRCSGFAIDHAHNIRAKNFAAALDSERQQISLNRAGQQYLREVVSANDIECGWCEEGKYHAAGTERGKVLLHAFAHNLDLLSEDYRHLDESEMKELTGTPFYVGGLFTPGTVLVQPAALVRGMACSMPPNVSVLEDCPVTAVSYGLPHRLQTPHGELGARTLVLANNGFGTGFGFYDKHVMPLSTFASLTTAMNIQQIEALGGAQSWGIIPADPFGTTVRRTADDRILIRNIYSYNPGFNTQEKKLAWAVKRHRQSFTNRFPMLGDLSFEYSWGGALCLSRNGEPIFGQLAERVFASLCHNGVGICRGTICGKLIAEDIAGHDSELLSVMRSFGRPNRNLPEPLMTWGAEISLANRRRKAGLEL